MPTPADKPVPPSPVPPVAVPPAEEEAPVVAAAPKVDAAPIIRRSVMHYDLATLAPPERLANGFLRAQGRIARIGPQVYVDVDGKQHTELRLPEEVFDAASLHSFAMVPLTNGHPPVLLDATNSKAYQVGSLGEHLTHDEEHVIAPLMVTDKVAIDAIERGRQQLSNGYQCDLDPTQAPDLIAKWGPYDFIQRNIRGNHVALVDVARAGPTAALRLDGGAETMQSVIAFQATKENPMPVKIKIAGREIEVLDGTAATVQSMVDEQQVKLDAALATIARVKSASAKLRASVTARADAMKARMMGCDECGGSGKVAGDAGAEKPCDYCHGKGSVLMHDAIKGAPAPVEEAPDADEPVEDAVTEIEVAQATEEEAGKAHKDQAARKVTREQARKDEAARVPALRQARLDSYDRMAKRRSAARDALVSQARKVLGADEKLDSKTDAEVVAMTIAKRFPDLKLDGRSADYIRARFDAAVESPAPAAPALSAIDAARAGMKPTPATQAAPRGTRAALEQSRVAFAKSRSDAWKPAPVEAKK